MYSQHPSGTQPYKFLFAKPNDVILYLNTLSPGTSIECKAQIALSLLYLRDDLICSHLFNFLKYAILRNKINKKS